MAKKLSEMVDILTDKQKLISFGSDMVDRIVERTQKGLDVKLNRFKPYSQSYYEKKRTGKLKRQATQFKPSSIKDVNLTLTTDMLNSLQVKKVTKKDITIGFPSQEAVKANANEVRGRVISSKRIPVSKDDEKFIADFFDKRILKAMKEASGKTEIIIG